MDFQEQVETLEEGGVTAWDDGIVSVTITIRDNYEVTRLFKFDEKGYPLDKAIAPVVFIDQKIVGKPEDDTNLCFMLDIMPHVSTGSHSYKHSIGNTWVPHFNTKNIHMKCKYLTF